MDISIVGAGHVGLVTGACFADLGNKVICMDNDEKKVQILRDGLLPIYEPGLEEMVQRNVRNGHLSFTNDLKKAVRNSSIIFIAVGTPPKPNGEADLIYVENVARQIAVYMDSYKLIVEKSTVPVETGKWVEHTIKMNNSGSVEFDVASNPEFLREGSAINDFIHPDRIVIGVESSKAERILRELYAPLGAPIIVTDIKSAEITKHASNSFLATKISFINAIANICEKVGADIQKVAEGMGLDKRIGTAFLNAGVGFGGACFPKDIDAFIQIAEKIGINFELLRIVKKINNEQRQLFINKIKDTLWILKDKTIGILGLSFKPGTDDMRNAPSIDIINILQNEEADIKAFDPQAMDNAQKFLKNVEFCQDAYQVAQDADCLLILTEWNEFKELNFTKIKNLMRQHIIIDGRNIYDPTKIQRLGFKYIGIARPMFHLVGGQRSSVLNG